MTSPYFTLAHVLISLAGIAAGFGAFSGLLAGKLFPRWTGVFLVTTAAASVTGFLFPFQGLTPAHAVGGISLIALALASYALHFRRLAGIWRKVFVGNFVLSLYLNVFVLIAQLFQKVPALIEIAPGQTGAAFATTQAVVVMVFLGLGFLSERRFRGDFRDLW